MNRLKKEVLETKVLLRSIPSLTMTLFVVSVVTMNLLANKSISLPISCLALDCGIFVSWLSFLSMDMITKYFGPKAATQASIVAVLVNLLMCVIFFIVKLVPGVWSASYVDGVQTVINQALDGTFGGTWYVLLGSTIAFLVSSLVNNYSNYLLGKKTKNDVGFKAYAFRSYVSTAIGQFCDNFVFALIVSHQFFGWTMVQCVMCSFTGMLVETLCEVLFSYPGYKIIEGWKKDHIGTAYLTYEKENG